MPQISNHGKARALERVIEITSINEAKKLANVAWKSGKSFENFKKYPRFYQYLSNIYYYRKRGKPSIRVYKDNIFIFRGQKPRQLVTVLQIPDKYLEEMKGYNNE